MKNLNLLNLTGLVFGIIFLFSSCSDDCESNGNCGSINPLEVMERVDIKIDGAETGFFIETNIEQDKDQDLVRYNYNANNPNEIEFIVKIADGRTLTIKLYNLLIRNPWEYSHIYYGIFPVTTLEDKFRYVTVELKASANSEDLSYSSMLNTGTAALASYIDVFRVEEFNTQTSEILGRLNEMVLHQVQNPEKTITLNGTFKGAITF